MGLTGRLNGDGMYESNNMIHDETLQMVQPQCYVQLDDVRGQDQML